MKPKIFIGSSREGLRHANALQKNLAYETHARVWNQGIFRAGNFVLEDLIRTLSEHDFGAFIFLPEDILTIRGERTPAVRDNLIFELGLFIGRLGRRNAFFIKPQGKELHLPSDLMGVTACDFDIEDENLTSGMGSAATEILDRIRVCRTIQESVRQHDQGYDRESLRQILAKTAPIPLVRGTKYTRNDIITTRGDVRIVEKWENVSAVGDTPVHQIELTFSSRSGRQEDCKCESQTPGQNVNWTWSPTNEEESKSALLFDPPLTKSSCVSFRTDRYVFNGISFTQADRLEITAGKSAEEEMRVVYRHLWDSCAFQIKFPEHRFPNLFRVAAYDPNGEILTNESEFINRDWNPLAETQNALLTIQNPLPAVRYKICWALPEGTYPLFSETEQGFVDEVTRRTLGLRVLARPTTAIEEALADAKAKFAALAEARPNEPVQVALYVYDRQRAGLVCAATLDAPLIETNWAKFFFKPGRGVVGTAFRERTCVTYIRGQTPRGDLFEPKIGDYGNARPHAIACVPLFYTGHPQRALAILSFESVSTTSSLIPFLTDPNSPARLEAAFREWYTTGLAQAVGMPSTHRYWRGESATARTS